MNNRWHFFCFLILFLISFSTSNVSAQSKKEVNIGIVHDGVLDSSGVVFDKLKNELTTLLGAKYKIQIPVGKILEADWSSERASVN